MLEHLIPILAFLANAWTAFSAPAAAVGLAGALCLLAAFLGLSWLPGFVKRPLIGAGLVLLVGAAAYQAGRAKGAHDAFALDAARAIQTEQARTAAARRVTETLALQATKDLAAAQADIQKLKDMNDALRTDPHRDRECLDRGLAHRLRSL